MILINGTINLDCRAIGVVYLEVHQAVQLAVGDASGIFLIMITLNYLFRYFRSLCGYTFQASKKGIAQDSNNT